MSNSTSETPSPEVRTASPAPMLLAAGGLAAAFGAAACCGLPLLLAGAGLGTAWLGGVGLFAAPHRTLLLGLAALLLVGGAAALWRQHRAAQACRVDGVCARPGVRLMTVAGLILGSGLLVLGYLYA